MLNFSFMTLDEEHIDAYCEDIAYQVKNKIARMHRDLGILFKGHSFADHAVCGFVPV